MEDTPFQVALNALNEAALLRFTAAQGAGCDPAVIAEFAKLLPPDGYVPPMTPTEEQFYRIPSVDRFCSDHEAAGSTSAEMFSDLAHLWGKERAPLVLHEAWCRGLFVPSDLRIALPPTWCAPMRPEPLLGTLKWLELFRAAGYRSPDDPIVIYRGAPSKDCRGMSWTTDIERATWFANHYNVRQQWTTDPQPSHIYRCTAQPEAVLCQIPKTIVGDLAWEENEVIVNPDPSVLTIEVVQP